MTKKQGEPDEKKTFGRYLAVAALACLLAYLAYLVLQPAPPADTPTFNDAEHYCMDYWSGGLGAYLNGDGALYYCQIGHVQCELWSLYSVREWIDYSYRLENLSFCGPEEVFSEWVELGFIYPVRGFEE